MSRLLALLDRRNLRIALIGLPLLVAALYLLVFAQNRFVSEAVIAVRQSGDRVPVVDGLAALLGGAGHSNREDTLLLRTYIESMDLLQELDEKLDLRKAWSEPKTDLFFRLSPTASREQFLKYYRNQVVATYDDTTGLIKVTAQAFTPELAAVLNGEVLHRAERFINESSQQMARDQMVYAETELAKARQGLQRARTAMQAFQKRHGVVDPMAQVQANTGLTSELQAVLARQEAELKGMLGYLNESAPQVVALRNQLAGTRAQLEAESIRAITTKRGSELTALAGEFQQLAGELQFAEDIYKTALTSLESARVESTRKLKSLVLVESPTRPESHEHPRRLYLLAALLAGLSLLYGVVRLVVATIEDHRQ